jgi:hypothetical protein
MVQKIIMVLSRGKPHSIHKTFDDLQKYWRDVGVFYNRRTTKFEHINEDYSKLFTVYDGLKELSVIEVEFDKPIY